MRSTSILFVAFLLQAIGCLAESVPNPVPVDAGPVCDGGPARASLCADQARIDYCSRDGLLNAAMCYEEPGADPLPELAGMYPSYGCYSPHDLNEGAGVDWKFWCCSKVTPGPLDRPCGTCSNRECLY